MHTADDTPSRTAATRSKYCNFTCQGDIRPRAAAGWSRNGTTQAVAATAGIRLDGNAGSNTASAWSDPEHTRKRSSGEGQVLQSWPGQGYTGIQTAGSGRPGRGRRSCWHCSGCGHSHGGADLDTGDQLQGGTVCGAPPDLTGAMNAGTLAPVQLLAPKRPRQQWA